MKREFLTELGVAEEQVDKIMEEYGKTINPLKSDKDTLDSQVKTLDNEIKKRDKQLEELSEKTEGHDDLKGQIQSLKQANEEAKKAYEKQIKQQSYDFALDKALMESKARNPVAVKALLDLEAIKLGEDGELIGLSEQLEKKKETDWYLFEDNDIDNDSNNDNNNASNINKHISGQSKKTNAPTKVKPYDLGKKKALERFKKEEN